MKTHNYHWGRSITGCLVGLAVFICIAGSAEAAQAQDGFMHEVRRLYTSDFGVPNPAGLVYLPEEDTFQIINAGPSDQGRSTFTELVVIGRDEELQGSRRVPVAGLDPLSSTYDEHSGGFLMLDRHGQNLVSVPAGADAKMQPSMLARHNIKSWGLNQSGGLTVDQKGGQIFILDLSGPRLLKVKPKGSTGWDDAYVAEVDLGQLGIAKPQGLALEPATGHLHLFNQKDQTLYEISQSGQIMATRGLTDLKLKNPRALVFAPSYDQTDDPQQMSLYLLDSGQSNVPETGAAPKSNNADSGSIIELSLYQPVVMAASTYTSVLQHTIDTSILTPPAPDPSDAIYLPSTNNLLICDSEVDEMTDLWANVNLFETNRDGTLVRTAKTTGFTKEPTGIAYNSANQHIFISDDSGRRIFEVDPGNDGLYCTADDVRTMFRTYYFGSNDPEGVTFDSASNTLFIVDGVNEEVYLVSPGTNGNFDGVAPYGDDQVTSFDTTILGIHDPEGICFYPATGHLYLTDSYSRTAVAEVTLDGTLVQIIDISAASARKPAGITLGPGSIDSAPVMYVADRGVDNDADPTENDGKVYELSIPAGNSAPTVSITSPANEAAYTEGEDVNLTSVLTNLPVGLHTITVTFTDSNGVTGTAGITITVNPVP